MGHREQPGQAMEPAHTGPQGHPESPCSTHRALSFPATALSCPHDQPSRRRAVTHRLIIEDRADWRGEAREIGLSYGIWPKPDPTSLLPFFFYYFVLGIADEQTARFK